MKTFNDIKEGDLVYTITVGNIKQIYSYFFSRIEGNDIFVNISNVDDIHFVVPKSNDTRYCGVYSCIEAIIKDLSDGI